MVSLDGSVGVPSVTMPISKPPLTVTKATDISDLTLEHIGQPQGASHRITLKFLGVLQLCGAPSILVPEPLSPKPWAPHLMSSPGTPMHVRTCSLFSPTAGVFPSCSCPLRCLCHLTHLILKEWSLDPASYVDLWCPPWKHNPDF